MYQLVFSEDFLKQTKKLSASNKSLKSQIRKTFYLLNTNWEHPSLRIHKLSGRDLWSISVNRNVRIIARLEGKLLFLLDIGKHKEAYRLS